MRARLGQRNGALIAALAAIIVIGLGFSDAASARGLITGFADDALFGAPKPAKRALWLGRARHENAGIIRTGVSWAAIAPSRPADPRDPADPAYDFSALDSAVTDADRRGFSVMLTVNAAPKWAEGPGRPDWPEPGVWRPNAAAFGDFAYALATRYSGHFVNATGATLPRVSTFEAWNEPNIFSFLEPQWNGTKAVAPKIYRGLLNAFYKGVKQVQHGATIVGGATAPVGSDPGNNSGMRPVTFLRGLFCFHQKHCNKPKLDVLSVHPITSPALGVHGGPRVHAAVPGDLFLADFHKAGQILHKAERAHHVGGPKHHSLWATEFWWITRSGNPAYEIPPKLQAKWIELGLYLLWKQNAKVAINFLIKDHPDFGSGVYTSSGKPKPAARTFRFPFVAAGKSKHSTGIWTRPPSSGTLEVQRKRGHHWKTVKRLHVKKSSVVRTKVHAPASAKLRGRIGSSTSLPLSAQGVAAATEKLMRRPASVPAQLAPYVESAP